MTGMGERERQWLAAVLTALSVHAQLASLTGPRTDGGVPGWWPAAGMAGRR